MFSLKVTIYLLDENSEVDYRVSGIKDSYDASQTLLTIVTRVAPYLNQDEILKLQAAVHQISTGTRMGKYTLSRRVNLKVAVRKE